MATNCAHCGSDAVTTHLPWLERLVANLGEPCFKDVVLDLVDECLPGSDYAVFIVKRHEILSSLEASQESNSNLSHLIGEYLKHFSDPDRRISYRPVREPTGKVICNVMDIERVQSERFRREFYERGGFVGQVYSIAKHQDGYIALSAFRRGKYGKYADDQLASFARIAPLVMPFVSRHASLTGLARSNKPVLSLDQASALVSASFKGLAPKEIEVCARILRGMTSEGIALDLGTSIHTVRTYRKRAYRKLQISSMTELFSKIVSHPAAAGNS